MKRICKNCKYWRDESWCSNSKSHMFIHFDPTWDTYVDDDDSCNKFYAAGLKAPWWLRLMNRIMGWVK